MALVSALETEDSVFGARVWVIEAEGSTQNPGETGSGDGGQAIGISHEDGVGGVIVVARTDEAWGCELNGRPEDVAKKFRRCGRHSHIAPSGFWSLRTISTAAWRRARQVFRSEVVPTFC